MILRPGFTGSPLDRADPVRQNPDLLAAARADPTARLLRLRGLDPAATNGALDWRAMDEAGADALALLGLIDGAPRFVALHADAASSPRAELWAAIAALSEGDAAIYAAARSLVDWHQRHPFCARCGHRTAPTKAGWARACPNCNAEHFPRTDPVVIMLAEHDGRALVGRQHAWPEGWYSALAGFVEVGEGIEDAVRRELHEEAGVVAGRVRYLTSQPWPFPSQLMIACIAEVESPDLRLDASELEAAMWIDRAQARAVTSDAPDAPFRMASPFAIAHTLIKAWGEGA